MRPNISVKGSVRLSVLPERLFFQWADHWIRWSEMTRKMCGNDQKHSRNPVDPPPPMLQKVFRSIVVRTDLLCSFQLPILNFLTTLLPLLHSDDGRWGLYSPTKPNYPMTREIFQLGKQKLPIVWTTSTCNPFVSQSKLNLTEWVLFETTLLCSQALSVVHLRSWSVELTSLMMVCDHPWSLRICSVGDGEG